MSIEAGDCDDSDPNSGLLCGITIPSGSFQMGCTPGQFDCYIDEQPVHPVTLSRRFWLARTEVTQGDWQALMGGNPSQGHKCGPSCPVDSVNWFEAAAFANALSTAEGKEPCYELVACDGQPGQGMSCQDVLVSSASGSNYDCSGYRLPTEAEWEYAARAGQDLAFSGSDTVDEVGWWEEPSELVVQPVAGLQPNAWGLFDMSGNVSEWTFDWYTADYYANSPETDPEGPSSGQIRSQRGGSWADNSDDLRVSDRNEHGPPTLRYFNLGLRVARSLD